MATNREIADLLDEFGRILELKEANVFKIRAFQSAARTVQSLSQNIESIYKDRGKKTLKDIDGIGKSISEIIAEYVDTGEVKELQELKVDIPEGLLDMVAIEGLGPKSVNKLRQELGISNIDELETAARAGKIRDISGFGKKTEENILEGIDLIRRSSERLLRMHVEPEAHAFIASLQSKFNEIKRIEIAGSFRRKRSTIGDVDILVQAPETLSEKIMEYIVNKDNVTRTLVSGKKKTSVLTSSDLHIDVRVIEDASEYAAHLQYFTGSKEHNIKVRQIAIERDLSLSEYGLKKKDDSYLNLPSEEKIYNHLGLSFVPPVLREDRGEIDLAKNNQLPQLVTKEMIKADFHVHSLWSEGSNSIKEMAQEAIRRGLDYIVLTDHTQDLVIANGMDEDKISDQMAKIREINDELDAIELFTGAELNIRDDGNVDLKDDTLEELDFAIASVHSGFKQDNKQITKRITTAMEIDAVKAIAHPTGRQVNRRDPYDVDIEKLVDVAIRTDTALEINGSERQDLSDIILHSLRDKSDIKFTLGSDAHATDQLANLDYAIDLAQRGWVNPDKILNTLSVEEFKKRFDID